MKKSAFTMVEMITVIVVMGILSAGTFVSLKHLYQRVAKSKALSELSFDSQLIADQTASLLYERVPRQVWGYKANSTDKTSIYDINSNDVVILEWYGTASEYLKEGNYSGFVDMNASVQDLNISTFSSAIATDKFNSSNTFSIAFAGSFDDGLTEYNVTKLDANLTVLQTKPDEIYEKYYLIDSAYAIARREDINTTTCSNFANDKNNTNTLFLFYNYHPWKGDYFCKDGSVTILSKEAKAFAVGLINDSLYFNITLERHIRGTENNITISKQKVVF